MIKKILLPAILLAATTVSVNAQHLFDEYFEYTAGSALVSNAVENSDNYDATTGWSTSSNSNASGSVYTITDAPLVYPGYFSSDLGNALYYDGTYGQAVFKSFSESVKEDVTLYIAFLINFPSAQPSAVVTGSDYFLGVKMSTSATDSNFASRLYAMYDPTFEGEEISFGINKVSGGTTTWVNGQTGPWYTVDETMLVVIKYTCGSIYGESSTEETDNYDDEMRLFVNPSMEVEPSDDEAILTHIDNTQKDAYRWGSSSKFGGLFAMYLRSAELGAAPAYIIDGILAATSYEALFDGSYDVEDAGTDEGGTESEPEDGITSTSVSEIAVSVSNGTLRVSEMYDSYELYSTSGAVVSAGAYESAIDVASLAKGVYLLKLTEGTEQVVAKVIL